jgi:hypothetical protein
VTAQQAVNICKKAYNPGFWNKDFYGFELGQDLPKSAHELMGWFVYNWRGKYNSDRLFFDAKESLTQELAGTIEINFIRLGYTIAGNTTGPMEYQFDIAQQLWVIPDIVLSAGKVSLPISMFMGSFWYQVKTLPDGRVGFRIDNDTTLSSGSHIALRHERDYPYNVEELIDKNESLKNKPLAQFFREYKVVSILRNRTRGETGGQGGGNLYQTDTWAEKRDCLARNLIGFLRIQAWDKAGVAGFESMTQDPPGWPAQ